MSFQVWRNNADRYGTWRLLAVEATEAAGRRRLASFAAAFKTGRLRLINEDGRELETWKAPEKVRA